MIGSIIAGVIAGYVACRLTDREGKGCLVNLLLGVIGGAVGGWLFSMLGIYWGGVLGEIGTAVVGAIVFLWVWNKLMK